AAERVFETVLAEEAEFLILAGDILDPQKTGPRGPIFLVEQFERLAERDIAVYWASGNVDPADAWPPVMKLPGNVHLFPRGSLEEFVHQRDNAPLARLIGAGRDPARKFRPKDFDPDPGGLFSIAVMHGGASAKALRSRDIHYWALGGRHDRSTLFSSPHIAHYPGSPQGRSPGEHGKHGCTLVQVDQEQHARTSLVPTDVMRWLDERVVVDEEASREDLESMVREQMHTLIETTPSVDLLVSWTIAGGDPLLSRIRREGLADELLEALRAEYGFGPPSAWSLSMDVEFSESLSPELYEQETICGDFLRAIRQFQMNSDEPLDLDDYVAEKHSAGVGAAIASPAHAIREYILREAALLGVDLLGPEEAES
ncbi:MAG: hypothetical protein ABIK89_11980, partial [Planctomycetota bacterium]